jgi:hypothetical protein
MVGVKISTFTIGLYSTISPQGMIRLSLEKSSFEFFNRIGRLLLDSLRQTGPENFAAFNSQPHPWYKNDSNIAITKDYHHDSDSDSGPKGHC